MHGNRGVIENFIEIMAKVIWRVYPEQAAIVLWLIKKVEKENLIMMLTQEGKISKWAKSQGIKLEFKRIVLLQQDDVVEERKGVNPAESMGLKLSELKTEMNMREKLS